MPSKMDTKDSPPAASIDKITQATDKLAMDDYDDEDYTPPPREAFHTKPELCKEMLRTVTAFTPLRIRSSNISKGSGLFVTKDTNAGSEIYRSEPLMSHIDAGNPSICHYCLETTADPFGSGNKTANSNGDSEARKACTGCMVARFCSKKCQRAAWTKFHKDECKILMENPKIRPEHLLVYRLVFWQQRKFITNTQGKVFEELENHFNEYSKVDKLIGEIFDVATAVRETTGGKVNLGLVWRLVPALRANCVRIRMAANKESVGAAFDSVTAVINHSCEPNAFVFFQGNQLRVRSLKKIAAGQEIIVCYIDPTLHMGARRELLQRKHFFECQCLRCRSEFKEGISLLKNRPFKKNSDRANLLGVIQRGIISTMKDFVLAAKYPGLHPEFEDLNTCEIRLRSQTNNAFDGYDWPDHLEPLPASRMCLAALYLEQEKLAPALRLAFQGKLMSRTPIGPEWVNDMMDLLSILIVAGSIPPDSPVFQDKAFPTTDDTRVATYGYLYEVCKTAGNAFGGDSKYTAAIYEMFAGMVSKSYARPGSKEFAMEFEAAQKKMLAWAGVKEELGLRLGA